MMGETVQGSAHPPAGKDVTEDSRRKAAPPDAVGAPSVVICHKPQNPDEQSAAERDQNAQCQLSATAGPLTPGLKAAYRASWVQFTVAVCPRRLREHSRPELQQQLTNLDSLRGEQHL